MVSNKLPKLPLICTFLSFSERFYLVLWEEEEDNVSVHSERELKKDSPEEKHMVGAACSVKFGLSWFNGKIASINKLIHGDPFEWPLNIVCRVRP